MTNSFQLFSIALRIFKRDWKRGDLLVLVLAMCIAMASVSVIYLTIDRIESASSRDVSEILGADLVITSPSEIPEAWLSTAKELGLQRASSIEFSSVLFANESIQLSSIKAISANFPLKGHLHIASTPESAGKEMRTNPQKGTIWVEPSIYNKLKINTGQTLELGYSDLAVDGVIMRQPGQGSTLFNIAPSAFMNIEDVTATQIIQPGSRIFYRYLFAGNDGAIKSLQDKVAGEKNETQKIVSIFDESPVAGTTIKNSKKYIGLSSLLSMVLLGVLIGGAMGVIAQKLLVYSFADTFVHQLPAAHYSVLIYPVSAAVILLFGFSLPSLIQLKSVPPMRVLRRQLQPARYSRWLVYGFSLLTLVLVMWLQIGDLKLLLSVLLGLAALMLVFTVMAAALLKLMKQFSRSSRNAAIKFSVRQLDANQGMTLLHLLAFSITLFVILLMVLVRTELLSQWQRSLGDEVPNHFMVNVSQTELASVNQYFSKHKISYTRLYPMVRGRITGINGWDVKQAVPKQGQQHNSLKRELNMTWSDTLPKGNDVVKGDWGWQDESEQPQISVEEKTAQALGLKLGDVINFTIGGVPWNAKIANVRSIDWQTFTPNFYIIAKPGDLDNFNATYITSFFLPKEKKALLSQIVKSYPSATVIELDVILEEVQGVISKVSRAVELIMLFVVAAGIALLWSAMEYSFDSKLKQSAILRTLGASQAFIARSFRFEYLWLALLSALMAIIAVELISYLLYTRIFEINFSMHWQLWWITPLITLIYMMLASWRGVKKVTEPSPLLLLRQRG
ncbi:MAG: ABC transporter permease [bacterium]